MKLLWLLLFSLLLVDTFSVGELQEEERDFVNSTLHLNLYHVEQGPNSISFSEALARDEERVKELNYRLAKKNASERETFKSRNDFKQFGPKSSSMISIPLNPGWAVGVGNYYVKVGLGTPPKYYPMVMDTGSSFSWLQCEPCAVHCHQQVGAVFNPSTSKTYRRLSCSSSQCSSLKDATLNDPLCTISNVCIYTASYGDSSYSVGYLSQDSLSLAPSESLLGFVYGCGQDNEGLFGQTAGLIGLARHRLSMLSQLSTKYGYGFSYCLPTGKSGSGGSLSVGRASLLPLASYKFTPMLTSSRDPSLYFLRLSAITVAGRPVGASATQYRGATIIDSGTVISRLPVSVYAALKQQFSKIMSTTYKVAPAFSILDTCFLGSVKAMAPLTVPKIRLIFQGGADMNLAPQNVLIDVDNGVTCLAFAGSSSTSSVTIIGNHQQQTFKVAYDISNVRIGFAEGGCH